MGNFLHREDLKDEEYRTLMKETGFSRKHLHRLFLRYRHLDKRGKGYLKKIDLLVLPEIQVNPCGEKIVDAFFPTEEDRLDFPQFAKCFAVFRPVRHHDKNNQQAPNSFRNKAKFLFDMIDIDRKQEVTKENILAILDTMLGAQVSHDQLVQITDRLVLEADTEHIGTIKFEEFLDVVKDVDMENKMAFVSFS